MPITSHLPAILASNSYAVLRYEGAPPGRAGTALGLASEDQARLERVFQRRRDPMRPRFARHAAHVDAVLAEGGYPVLPERGR